MSARAGVVTPATLVTPKPPSYLGKNLYWLTRFSILLAGVIAVCGLLGAALGMPELRSLIPDHPTLKINASICLLLLALSLALLHRKLGGWISRRRRAAARALSLVAALIGSLSLSEIVYGWDLGIDQLLFSEPASQAIASIRPGLMSPLGAVSALLLGMALAGLDWRPRRLWPSQALALAATFFSAIGIFDYILRSAVEHTRMPLPAALAYLALSLGIVCSRTDRGLGALLASPNLGGTIVRALFPTSLLVPAVIGYVRWKAYEEGLYSEWFGVTLMSLSAIALLAGITIATAMLIERTDRERQRAAEELRSSEQRYRSLVVATAQIVWITDADGQVVTDMPMWRAFTGVTRQEIQGSGWINCVHPDDRDRTAATWKYAVSTRSLYETEYRLRRHDGEYRHVAARGVPVLENGGRIREWVGTCTDITPHKAAENELREQAALLNLAHDAILVRDTESRITFWSRGAADTYGWSATEAQGQISHDLLHAKLPVPLATIDAILQQKGEWEGELSHCRRDGTPLMVASRWSLQRDENGQPKAILEINRDISDRKRAEEALRRSETRLQLQFERMPLGCIVWNKDFRVVSWNPAAERIFGFSAAEVIGRHPFDCIVPKTAQPTVDDIYQRLLEGDATAHSENQNITKDGRTIECQWTNTPLVDPDGETVGILSMVEDVTDRRESEEQLRRASLYARTLIEASLDPLVTISKAGRIMDVNQATEEVTGISRERLIGTDFCSYFTDPANARRGYEEVFAKGSVRDYPLVLRGEDGQLTHVLYNATVFKNEAGEVEGVFAAARDITERKRAEEAIRQERQRLRDVLDGLPTYVVLLTPDYHATFVNQVFRERFGEANPGQRCFELLFSRTEPCEICETYKVLKTMEPLQWKWIGPDGRSYIVYDFPFKDTDGSTLILEMGLDITEQERAEQEIRKLNDELEQRVRVRTAELEASNKELEAFTYSVSHDLRAPLRHISGFSKILLEEYGSHLPVEGQHYLQRVAEGTLRMGTLVDDLLNLARVGRHEVRTQVTGLNSILEEVRAELKPECEGRQVEWKIATLPFVECDPSLIKQVFQNLLSNALKFTRPRSPAVIEIGQIQEQGRTAVFVRDNGVGFSMKYADKLFGVFQRLHRTEDFEGTGVGLATALRIIRKHGGAIWAEAELDKGATFYFTVGVSETVPNEKQANEMVPAGA